jgi:hypothetical protein
MKKERKMNKRRILSKVCIAISLVALASTAAVWQMRRVQANPLPTAVESQTSFGIFGIALGQTMRVSVANTLTPTDVNIPPDPCRVLINFRDMSGDLVHNRAGQVVFRDVLLSPGQSTFLDVGFLTIAPSPSTNAGAGRIQIRPVVTSQLSAPSDPEIPPDPCVPVVEVFNDLTGRTDFGVFGPPAVRSTTSVSTN